MEVVGKDPSSVLRIKLSDYTLLKTPVSKARFIKRLMDTLLTKNSKRVAEKVMLECGYMMREGVSRCINEPRVNKAKKLYKESKDTNEFLARCNTNHIAGNLTLKGNIIRATYKLCYCGSVSKTTETIPLIYCYCGAGWYKRLFEEALGKPVRVKVVRSIASGARTCEFEIHLKHV
jgi:predicted hydrocarbon binding protein